jgi:cobalt-zinc-cadmium efflux system outer membrane protein
MTRSIYLFVLLLLLTQAALAQQRRTLQECEEVFLQRNLLLLAEQYNIGMAKAAVIQAKIWELPYISGEFNAINPQYGHVLSIGNNGQKALALQQLIYLGHKKKNEIEVARSNVELAEIQFEDLLRNLRYQLHQSFYSLYFEQQKAVNIGTQLVNIDTLAQAYATQATKGNLPLRDVVRLQSLSLALKNDLLAIQKNINADQETLKIMTGYTENLVPQVDESALSNTLQGRSTPNIDTLYQVALRKNPEYRSQLKLITNNELALKWQKSLAVPDLTAGLNYDQRGGAFQNQVNFTVGIPLPLWNRNKGNIQLAEAQLQQSKLQVDYKQIELRQKLENAYATWTQQQQQFDQLTNAEENNRERVYEGILQNFQKRNVSLLEFTDFMESYSQSILQVNELKKQLLLSRETLNYIINDKLL